jgi:hypothetical protein
MKIFILCICIVCGILAIAIYAKGVRHRIEDLKDESNKMDM